MYKRLIITFYSILLSFNICAQLTDGTTGLLHMPNAEIQDDGILMTGGNYLNSHNIPYMGNMSYKYHTYNYYVNITLFNRIEISYICTLNKGVPGSWYWPESTWGKYTNQDRHFAGKIQLLKEGEWWKHMPSIAIGVSDPTTGDKSDYTNMAVDGSGNGYFNRWYVAITKHFNIKNIGELGVHAAYLYNKRTDYPLNGPAFGINFRPDIHKNLNLIAEYDAKTINVGAIYSLWADHFNFLFELQEGKYISAGLVYKVNLKGGNKWNSKIFE